MNLIAREDKRISEIQQNRTCHPEGGIWTSGLKCEVSGPLKRVR